MDCNLQLEQTGTSTIKSFLSLKGSNLPTLEKKIYLADSLQLPLAEEEYSKLPPKPKSLMKRSGSKAANLKHSKKKAFIMGDTVFQSGLLV